MGKIYLEPGNTIGIWWMGYTAQDQHFEVMISCFGKNPMYSVNCGARGFSTGIVPGTYQDAIKAAEDFIINTTKDPMSVIMGRVERRLKGWNEMFDFKLAGVSLRTIERNTNQQLEADLMAFAINKMPYANAQKLFNNLTISNYEQANASTVNR